MKKIVDIEGLIRLITSEFDDIDPKRLDSESLFKEVIEWNSINSLVLSVVIESEYGVLLEKENYNNANTISDLEDIIRKMYS